MRYSGFALPDCQTTGPANQPGYSQQATDRISPAPSPGRAVTAAPPVGFWALAYLGRNGMIAGDRRALVVCCRVPHVTRTGARLGDACDTPIAGHHRRPDKLSKPTRGGGRGEPVVPCPWRSGGVRRPQRPRHSVCCLCEGARHHRGELRVT